MASGLRNRKQSSMASGMLRLETVMSDSVLRIRHMPTRAKVVVFLSLIFSLCFYLYIGHWLISSDPEKSLEALLETEKCPACFGYSACGMFYHDQLQLVGASKYRLLDMINGRNVHYGQINYNGMNIVLKKMATNSEVRSTDKYLCENARREEGCDVARVIVRTDIGASLFKGSMTPEILEKTGGFMFHCPSYRLIDRIWTYFREFKKKDQIFISDKMQVLYTALVNPEPLLLQTFPKKEGWPFPEYLGSCGRIVVEEHAGTPLSQYFYAAFSVRAALAYELMKIAEMLTDNKSEFALYLTDVSFDNFVVDGSGQVKVIDLENIIVVDKMAIKARKPRGYKEPHEGIFNDCDGKNCLSFSSKDLCSHVRSDHNYNAICRNLLSPYANENGLEGGLLHSMPTKAMDFWDLGNLLEECVRPKDKEGRWRAKEKILAALEDLKEEKDTHLKKKKERE